MDSTDVQAVMDVLVSEYLTQGPMVSSFEADLASKVGARYVTAVNSATSALHLSCLALGVKPGDLVWTTAISFVASANAALYCGAEVDFVDIDLDSFNISAQCLEEKLRQRVATGQPTPKVMIVVHMAGQPCEMKKIYSLAKEFGFSIVEDASHALGSVYSGSLTGSCEYSDITVFSFHPVKMITTGEGGACLTNKPEIHAKIQRLRSHGITRDVNEMEFEYPGSWYYEQLDLGFNYRLSDIQAALGQSQLKRLDEFVQKRNEVADWYGENLREDQVVKPKIYEDRISSFHLYVVLLANSNERKVTFERLRSNGIAVNVHYIPIYRHPYYKRMGKYNPLDFPAAEEYYSRCLSLPIFPGISESQLKQVASIISEPIGHQTIF